MSDSTIIAQSLLRIGAVGFRPNSPLTFKSGLKSPVYVDNRSFPFHPSEWEKVIKGFAKLIEEKALAFEVIAGIETAGIPHSAALGFFTKKPSVFIRKQLKDHGTKKRVEGGNVEERKVLLIEDHVTTGLSSLSGVKALRKEKAVITDCLSITSYEFHDAEEDFENLGVKLHTLTTFSMILNEALKEKKLNKKEIESVQDWFLEPWGWAERHGFEPSVRISDEGI